MVKSGMPSSPGSIFPLAFLSTKTWPSIRVNQPKSGVSPSARTEGVTVLSENDRLLPVAVAAAESWTWCASMNAVIVVPDATLPTVTKAPTSPAVKPVNPVMFAATVRMLLPETVAAPRPSVSAAPLAVVVALFDIVAW